MPFGAPFPGGGLVVTVVGNASGAATSFSGVNFGTADGSRYLVVASNAVSSIGNPPTGCTIGGISATLIIQGSATNVTQTTSQIWIALVPTGTSGTVAFSGGVISAMSVQVYNLIGLSSASADATTTGTTSGSLSVNSNGTVFAAAGDLFTGSGSATWTGLTGDQNVVPTAGYAASAAHASGLTAQTLSISVAWGGTIRAASLAAASYH